MKNQLHVKWRNETAAAVLNLDYDFNPVKDQGYFELGVKKFSFPGGEQHIRITTEVQYFGKLLITHRFTSTACLFDIILANDAARRMGYTDIELMLPYFPGARQDRVCNDGEPLTVKVFADLINSCGFSKVYIYSPHSEVTPALINNVVELDYDKIFLTTLIENKVSTDGVNIVCPDAGAGKRTAKLAKYVKEIFPLLDVNLVRCEKVRDVLTGELFEFFVSDSDLNCFDSIIVDDICVNGGTFVGLKDKLIGRNCGNIMLFTSHADVENGLNNMVAEFDYYATTNSKKNWTATNPNKFTCFEITL